MATFTEALTGIIPDIRTGAAAEVRSSLFGLARQLQEDSDSQSHSLQTWWQWLMTKATTVKRFRQFSLRFAKSGLANKA